LVEAIMLWNEPNNKSHWDFEVDPGWQIFARMINVAADCVKDVNPNLPCVLGGISPIDPKFIETLARMDVMNHLDVIAVHGFPLDWNHWTIHEWPDKLREIKAATDKPVWVSEVGVSTFGAEEVQEWGLQRTAELLAGNVERVHWYSLFDLPKSWPATTRHREAEGSAYYRHFYMGLIREDGCPKLAYKHFHKYTPQLGICQWFHYQDHRLEDGVRRLQDLGVRYIRTGVSWADYYRENALDWFDRQMKALEPFDVTLTYCFTPEHKGLAPHYTSPPKDVHEFGEFCAEMTRRYARP
jgi:beta-xylosidase